MTKHWLGLFAAAWLLACAPPEEEGVESVGASASHQTTAEPRVIVRSVAGQTRFLTIGAAPPGAVEEARYGIRSAGGIALNTCWVNGVVPSGDPSCEGLGPALGVIGYVDGATGIPLYRCVGPSGRFPTTDPSCQGQGAREGLLGYVDTATPERWSFGATWLQGGEGGGEGDGVGGGGGSGDGAGGVGVGGSL